MTAVAIAVALAVQGVPSVVPPASVDTEIIVIGRKLKAWRGRLIPKKGGSRCVVERSTGDKDIDAVGCSAMRTCMMQLTPRLAAAADRNLKTAARRQMTSAAYRDMGICFQAERSRLIEQLAERRYQEGARRAED